MNDLEFIRPICEWYGYMSESQKTDMPMRVLNALDSLQSFMGRKS